MMSIGAPSFSTTAVSASQINLGWSGVSGASGYLIDEWVNSDWKQIANVGSGTRNYSVSGLNAGTTYYFDVAAYNGSGTAWANWQSATTRTVAPTFTTTAVSASQINLAWSGVSGTSGYLIDEWINGAWAQIANVSSGTRGYAVSGLNAGTTYYFDVAAYNSAGTAWANFQSATTRPTAPSFTTTAVSASQINLAWSGVSGTSGYLIDEWINGAWAQIANVGSGTRSYAVSGLNAGTTYYFDVATYNSSGTTWANWQSATTRPAAPSFSTTAVSTSQINLAWSGVSGASGYVVDEWINGQWQQIANLGTFSRSYSVSGLTADTTYYFDVGAYNSSGTTWPNWQSATTAPLAASFTATAVSASQIDLVWSSVSGASGYLVDQWINDAWTQIANVGSGTTSYAVSGLSADSTYYFEVGACNSAGTTWANFQSAKTSAPPTDFNADSWSGYVAATDLGNQQADSVTAVSGSWIVPTVTGTAETTSYSSIWVGIDGFNGETVEQIGTEENIIEGKAVYRAWYEMFSTVTQQVEQVITDMPISPGDSISASVVYMTSGDHAGQYQLSITDTSQTDDSFTTYQTSAETQNPRARRSCAEWIVEVPTLKENNVDVHPALANFDSVTFTNATATIGGVTGPIDAAAWQSGRINLAHAGAKSSPSGLTDALGASQFTVTYTPPDTANSNSLENGRLIACNGSQRIASIVETTASESTARRENHEQATSWEAKSAATMPVTPNQPQSRAVDRLFAAVGDDPTPAIPASIFAKAAIPRFVIALASEHSIASQFGSTSSSMVGVMSTDQTDGAQVPGTSRRVSSALNVGRAAADRIMATLDDFDVLCQTISLDYSGQRNGWSKDPDRDSVTDLALLSLAGSKHWPSSVLSVWG
jgi:uncharacterized protein YccT (UPF0319 family)